MSDRKVAEIWYDTTREESVRFKVIHQLSGVCGYGLDPEAALDNMRAKTDSADGSDEAELLRRLSAGNPQAEKVQITSDPDAYISDGRILGQLGMRSGDAVARYAPVSDGRIQSCECSCHADAGVACDVCRGIVGVPRTKICSTVRALYGMPQAQRSAGRVEAGSEQGPKSAAEGVLCDCEACRIARYISRTSEE